MKRQKVMGNTRETFFVGRQHRITQTHDCIHNTNNDLI